MSTGVSRRLRRWSLWLIAGLVIALGARVVSARQTARPSPAAAQKIDEAYTKKIIDGTPDKRILTELIDHMPLPLDPKVPSPLEHLGYVPGEGGNLTYSKDVYA